MTASLSSLEREPNDRNPFTSKTAMPNALQLDPSRTTTLRYQFRAQMRKRFRAIRAKIRSLVDDEDAFGIRELSGPVRLEADPSLWRFQTDADKVKGFREWLAQQVDEGILDSPGGDPWTDKFIESAYRKGYERAYMDSRQMELIEDPDLFQGGRREFLRTAFQQPETVSKLQLLYTRTFSDLEGITATMDTQLSRALALGLADGKNPREIAGEMSATIDKLTRTRAETIARTEVIRAHAEGQLDSFEELGVKELDIMVEWSTAGDDRVCQACASRAGKVYTVKEARGIIPLHPNCRCTWIPAQARKEEI